MMTHVLTLNSIIQRDPEVIAAEADQDLIMVSIATGYYYGLSDVAREIWDAIERPKRISDLVDDLTANYQIDSILVQGADSILPGGSARRGSVAGERWAGWLSSGL